MTQQIISESYVETQNGGSARVIPTVVVTPDSPAQLFAQNILDLIGTGLGDA